MSTNQNFCMSALSREEMVGDNGQHLLTDADIDYYKKRVSYQLNVLNNLIKDHDLSEDPNVMIRMEIINNYLPSNNRYHEKITRFADSISFAVLVIAINTKRFTMEERRYIRETHRDALNFGLNVSPRFFERQLIRN